jgi:hypothetical protein
MRLPTPRGTQHPNARFDDAELLEVRKELGQGQEPEAIARKRGCHPKTIQRIQRGDSYRER